jgi:hypothetical protein
MSIVDEEYDEIFSPWYDPDDYHSETCTCEHCIQNYPERACLNVDAETGDVKIKEQK